MEAKQLRPAAELVRKFGVKAVMFGGPGSGKTPLCDTAPRPVLCAVEPGLLSMRQSKVPTWEAFDLPKIEEFLKWVHESKEAANFDTICIDSISEIAEKILLEEERKNKDGRAAYGAMADRVMAILNKLYYMPNKHIYLIAKQGTFTEGGVETLKPYFPGKELNVSVPHMFDEILHLGLANVPNMREPVKAIRTRSSFGIFARDRSGMLDEFEPPNLAMLFNKAMSF